MKVFITVDKKKTEFTLTELRGIFTMCEELPPPRVGSRETFEGIKKLEKIVGGRFCRECTEPAEVKDRRTGNRYCFACAPKGIAL